MSAVVPCVLYRKQTIGVAFHNNEEVFVVLPRAERTWAETVILGRNKLGRNGQKMGRNGSWAETTDTLCSLAVY